MKQLRELGIKFKFVRTILLWFFGESPSAALLGYRGVPALPGPWPVTELDRWGKSNNPPLPKVAQGELTRKRTIARATLEYKGTEYQIERDFGYDYPAELVDFYFKEGNGSCDCNRSLWIGRQDDTFSEMNCGEEIKLKDLAISYLVDKAEIDRD